MMKLKGTIYRYIELYLFYFNLEGAEVGFSCLMWWRKTENPRKTINLGRASIPCSMPKHGFKPGPQQRQVSVLPLPFPGP